MAMRWVQRLNPISWITKRDPRRAPVVPGGQAEYATPAEYVGTSQDDYSAADNPALVAPGLEYFAEHADDEGTFDEFIAPTYTINPPRPRTREAEYNSATKTLRVTYRGGVAYDYTGVEPGLWASLQRERTSTGKWLARNGLGGPGSGTRV